jgi:hypothetical protein
MEKGMSTPKSDRAQGVKITKCPPGKALGADDLTTWAQRRATGKVGVPTPRKEEKKWRKRHLRRVRRAKKKIEQRRANDPRFEADLATYQASQSVLIPKGEERG